MPLAATQHLRIGASRAPRTAPLRRSLLDAARKVLYWSGAGLAYVRIARVMGAAIVMYHSVPSTGMECWSDPANAMPASLFAQQMRYLIAYRRVISMSELVSLVKAGRCAAPGTVVVTFDDGYRDNLEVAVPILRTYAIPATIYLPTGYITRGRTQWIDELYSVFRFRSLQRLKLLRGAARFDLRRREQAAQAYALLRGRLCEATADERDELLQDVRDQLQPSETPPRLTMTWDEVRQLVRENPNIEIGGHTCDHTDLRHAHRQAAQEQIDRCMSDIERELGLRPVHFSYPYARWNREAQQMVARAGFISAVSCGPDYLVGAGSDRFALPRISPPRSMALFRFDTSGAYPGLPLRLMGRA